MDMHFQNFGHSLDRHYWRFLGDPIYDTFSEESAYFEALRQPNVIEANS